jgi:hypothetical protein
MYKVVCHMFKVPHIFDDLGKCVLFVHVLNLILIWFRLLLVRFRVSQLSMLSLMVMISYIEITLISALLSALLRYLSIDSFLYFFQTF